MGGEKGEKGGRSHEQQGSPPRGRGKAHKLIKQRHVAGITPAWAGKRFCKEIAPPSVEDHPRVGGEKFVIVLSLPRYLGSPPRGRGKENRSRQLRFWFRITPAWAGKSLFLPVMVRLLQDHPRVGGEKCGLGKTLMQLEGSPPRGRGKAG